MMPEESPNDLKERRWVGVAIGAAALNELRGNEQLCRTERKWPMLVLSRKKNESIVINNDIRIVVVEIRGDKVRLGVEAPREVPVHRREVYDAIQRGKPAGDDATESAESLDS
jgi:carbon storage regulator